MLTSTTQKGRGSLVVHYVVFSSRSFLRNHSNAPTIQLTDGLFAKAKKSKHFMMLINFVKEQVLMGLIEVQKMIRIE